MPEKSPGITHFEWGIVHVEGYDKPFRDVKLYPGGAKVWDWSETGTHHDPGIQPVDVQELIEMGAQIVVLSKGVHERLLTMQETLTLLEEHSITVHVLQTEQAVAKYNELAASEAVAALIHLTC